MALMPPAWPVTWFLVTLAVVAAVTYDSDVIFQPLDVSSHSRDFLLPRSLPCPHHIGTRDTEGLRVTRASPGAPIPPTSSPEVISY